MNKLKNKKIKSLLNYNKFLKNHNLKKNKFRQKDTLFESNIILKNKEFNLIELDDIMNILIPNTVHNFHNIYTIKTKYEEKLLFNYDLTYNLLKNFNKVMFKFIIKKNNTIRGRVLGGTNRYVFILILGIIFKMNSSHLHHSVNNKRNFFKNNKFKKRNHNNFFKRIRPKQLVNSYKLLYLNFKINIIPKLKFQKKRQFLSRTLYLKEIINEQNKITLNNNLNVKKINDNVNLLKKNKKNFSRKLYASEKQQK